MKNKRLQFSKDRSEFQIIFKNGEKSTFYDSKEAGFKAINDLVSKKRITTTDFGRMRDEILAAKKLPWSKRDAQPVQNPLEDFDFVVVSPFIFRDIQEMLFPTMFSSKKPVEVACFKMCSHCNLHGIIYAKNDVQTDDLGSKEEASTALAQLKAERYVDDAEFKKVKLEIEQSSLPARVKRGA
jgi:hypothetical protein